MRVAVVGGGFAGLTAAWELTAGGAAVTLYDARAQLGGRVRSDALDGHLIDSGVQLFGSSFDRVFHLLRATGAADPFVRAPGRDAVCRDERIVPVTYGSISSMLASGSLSTRLKLRLGAKYLPFLARHARGLDANSLLESGGVPLDDRSAADFGRAELGDEFVDALVHPLLAAYYGTPADEASGALLHALALAGMDVKVYAARAGAGALAHGVGTALERRGATLRLDTVVDSVAANAAGVRVEAGGASESFDAVVVATPAPAARALLADQPALRAWLENVRMRATVTLALSISQRVPGGWFGLSFPRAHPAADRIAAICVQRNKRPAAQHPEGDALVVIPSPRFAATLADAEPGAIVDGLVPSVRKVFPWIEPRILRARSYRFEDGYTVYYAGYLARLAGLDMALLPQHVALAGDYLGAPTVEGAARSGFNAARTLLARR